MTIRSILRASLETLRGDREDTLRCDFTLVEEINQNVLQIVADLRDTLHSDTLSVGLAAPQIGHPEAITVININKDVDEDLVLINPKIINESGQKDKKYESCMSILHKRGMVERRKKVRIEYRDLEWEKKEINASGFLARVIQHEIDHLNGKLYTDHLQGLKTLEKTDIFRKVGIE